MMKKALTLFMALVMALSLTTSFWAQESEHSEPKKMIIGDLNGDGAVSDKDAVFLVRYVGNIWKGVVIPPYLADFNDDGLVSDVDSVILLRYIGGWKLDIPRLGKDFDFYMNLVSGDTISKIDTLDMDFGSESDIILKTDFKFKNYEWSSSDESVVAVDGSDTSAKLSAVSSGSAVITVKTESLELTLPVSVKVPSVETGVTDGKMALNLSDEKAYIGQVQPKLSGTVVPATEFQFTSSDEAIAKVNLNGYVFGYSAGTAVITVKHISSGVTAEFEVTCTGEKNFTEDFAPFTPTTTYYGADCSDYGITWHSKYMNFAPTVQFVEKIGDASADFTASSSTIASAELSNTDEYVYKAVVSGLKYNTEYYYRIGDADSATWGDVYTIKTREENVDSFTFLHMSDTQAKTDGGVDAWNKALENSSKAYPDASFILHTGDIVEDGWLESSWREMLDGVSGNTMNLPMMTATGNHDVMAGGKNTMYNHFNVQYPEQTISRGMYYSFDYGDAHFIILNTNDTRNDKMSLEQVSWLEDELANNTSKWTIVAMHNPMYSPAKWGSSPNYNNVAVQLRRQLNSIFEEYGVDMVFQGHDHVYCRTYPIDGSGNVVNDTATENGKFNGQDVTYMVNPQGTVFHETATSGDASNEFEKGIDMSYFQQSYEEMTSAWTAVNIDGDKLTVMFYDKDGNVKDSYGIVKK